MNPSKKFLSLPIVTLSEGQHIGYVKSLVIDSQSKALAALVIDPKGFFKDQRIIPYAKVTSVGEDAITIDKGSHVEKSASLPEILTLIKEKLTIIGTRVITQSGKTLGVVEEYFVDPETGKITQIEISGGKLEGFFSGKAILDAEYIVTIGQDVIVAQKGCETNLIVADKGINETFKSFLHSTSNLASGTSQTIGKLFSKDKDKAKGKNKLKSKGKGKDIVDNNDDSKSVIIEGESMELALEPVNYSDPAPSSDNSIVTLIDPSYPYSSESPTQDMGEDNSIDPPEQVQVSESSPLK